MRTDVTSNRTASMTVLYCQQLDQMTYLIGFRAKKESLFVSLLDVHIDNCIPNRCICVIVFLASVQSQVAIKVNKCSFEECC